MRKFKCIKRSNPNITRVLYEDDHSLINGEYIAISEIEKEKVVEKTTKLVGVKVYNENKECIDRTFKDFDTFLSKYGIDIDAMTKFSPCEVIEAYKCKSENLDLHCEYVNWI